MKKRIFYYYSVLFVVMLFTGCKDDKPVSASIDRIEVNLKAAVGSSLKVTNGGDWELTDKIGLYMKKSGAALSTTAAVYSDGDNLEMSIDGDRLSSTPSLYYPAKGNVDFIAYYPYTSSVSADYTIDVSVAEQSTVVETLYSANVENQAPTQEPVTLDFKYSMAKLVVTVTGSDGSGFTSGDLDNMSVFVNGMFTEAQLNLVDGSFSGHQSPGIIALRKSAPATTSVRFEALVLPDAEGDRTFLFKLGNVSFPYVVKESFNAATEYRFNFTLNVTDIVWTVTLLNASILPRNIETRDYVITGGQSGYFKLLSGTAGGMTVTQLQGDYHYLVTTTGDDPYVSTDNLTEALQANWVVLCFQYKSSADLDFLQVYFSHPISEQRSVKSGLIPASPSEWTEWALTLKAPLAEHAWGNVGQYLRLDFGDNPGFEMELKNIYFRGMTQQERIEEEERAQQELAKKQFDQNLRNYLDADFSSVITEVNAEAGTITVNGYYSGLGDFALGEITPYQDVTQMNNFAFRRALSSSSFSETFERYVERDGFIYDRTLSKWAIVRKSANGNSDVLVSHACYPDNIHASQVTTQAIPASKKGLGAYYDRHRNTAYSNVMRQDLDDLGITSVTLNLEIVILMHSGQTGNAIEHQYGGKTYYFDKTRVEQHDANLRDCAQRNIVVAAIILVQSHPIFDQTMLNILRHPDFPGSHSTAYYSMPNMTNPESVNAYAAALDFLASRYSRPDGLYGRIHHWIMHNEVNIGYEWTNMGTDVSMNVYTDAYMKSMRMCYNIVRRYDQWAEVFASFTQSWAGHASNNSNSYLGLSQINLINDYCRAEGDFQWALAFHTYPQELVEPRLWSSSAESRATYSYSTQLVTFKNLEVLNAWAKRSENMYKGSKKRSLWLSENGLGSRNPSLFVGLSYTAEEEQAAGFAWTWKKLNQLDGIDAMQWHNLEDTAFEDNLRIGLRKSSTDALAKKDVWYAYQAAGTADEDSYFAKYLPIIGILNWNNLVQTIP